MPGTRAEDYNAVTVDTNDTHDTIDTIDTVFKLCYHSLLFQFGTLERKESTNMAEPKSTSAQLQQLAMQSLAQADTCTIKARKHLEDISPLMKNSSVYEQLVKLSRTINEALAKVNGLSL